MKETDRGVLTDVISDKERGQWRRKDSPYKEVGGVQALSKVSHGKAAG